MKNNGLVAVLQQKTWLYWGDQLTGKKATSIMRCESLPSGTADEVQDVCFKKDVKQLESTQKKAQRT